MPWVPGPRPSHSSEARKVMSRRIRVSDETARAGAGATFSAAVTREPASTATANVIGNHRHVRMGIPQSVRGVSERDRALPAHGAGKGDPCWRRGLVNPYSSRLPDLQSLCYGLRATDSFAFYRRL